MKTLLAVIGALVVIAAVGFWYLTQFESQNAQAEQNHDGHSHQIKDQQSTTEGSQKESVANPNVQSQPNPEAARLAEEAVKLNQAGLSQESQEAWAKGLDYVPALDAFALKQMRDNGVPDVVMETLSRKAVPGNANEDLASNKQQLRDINQQQPTENLNYQSGSDQNRRSAYSEPKSTVYYSTPFYPNYHCETVIVDPHCYSHSYSQYHCDY